MDEQNYNLNRKQNGIISLLTQTNSHTNEGMKYRCSLSAIHLESFGRRAILERPHDRLSCYKKEEKVIRKTFQVTFEQNNVDTIRWSTNQNQRQTIAGNAVMRRIEVA